jgi:hypothetical protein
MAGRAWPAPMTEEQNARVVFLHGVALPANWFQL